MVTHNNSVMRIALLIKFVTGLYEKDFVSVCDWSTAVGR